MSRNKKYIIITGQIASGKSSISELIKKRNNNYLVLDADDQIKELYKRGAELYKVLVNEFGVSILNEKGNISKAKLRRTVFLNDENREKLNELTHPVILKNMVSLAKESEADVVFLQIPLLNESINILKKLVNIDEIWNITASDEVRFNRLMSRKGMTEEIAHRIMEIQSDFESDDFDILSIENNGDYEELNNKLNLLFDNSCIKEEKKIGFFGRFKKNKKEEIEELNEESEDTSEEESDVRKVSEDEIINEDMVEENAEELLVENENNSERLLQTIFTNEQKTENIDLKEIEEKDLEKTKLTDLSPLREDKIEKIENDINNSVEETLDEEVNEDKGKKKKKMKIWKKILLSIVSFLIIINALFLGAIYYGGVNYPVNYLEEIQKYSNEYGVDPKVVLAIMRVESNFKTDATSKVNAKGLMQVLPDTAKHVAKLLNIDVNSIDLNDAETNIKIGTYYIKYLMQNFSNMDTVYAAYNGGIGNVNTWLKDSKYSSDGVSLYNIPSSETKHYVNKVNKALKAYEILYGKEFPTKKTKGFSKFVENVKNTIRYILSSF
ncbi:dephospho-CoA kinase [Parvimonas sp. G1641]|uniref:dephospho-CoA kinase n=1 Tax=Parvimonas sp. G1641 TaxID=3388846 RepID=UPI003980B4A1